MKIPLVTATMNPNCETLARCEVHMTTNGLHSLKRRDETKVVTTKRGAINSMKFVSKPTLNWKASFFGRRLIVCLND